MTLEEAVNKSSRLLETINKNYSLSYMESVMLMCHTLNVTKTYIIANNKRALEEKEEEIFFSLCKRRLNYEPISYIIGSKEFYGSEYFVDKNVLIPRPETEELIDLVMDNIYENDINICDIGGGSGNISITLKKLKEKLNITVIDISEEAVKIIRKNAVNILKDENSINIICSDALLYMPEKKFDVIVSNAPYVPIKDKDKLAKDIFFEPETALFSGYDGLDFYRSFIKRINLYLKTCGKFFFEIGEEEGENILRICKDNSIENAEIKKDLCGKDRFIICKNYKP